MKLIHIESLSIQEFLGVKSYQTLFLTHDLFIHFLLPHILHSKKRARILNKQLLFKVTCKFETHSHKFTEA